MRILTSTNAFEGCCVFAYSVFGRAADCTYHLTRDELPCILDPADVYGPDFPGETFRLLKEKEQKLYSEYRTRRLVLEAWDKLPNK